MLAHASLVGLLLRDLGVVKESLEAIGVREEILAHAWLFEVERAMAELIASSLVSVDGYARASTLSGIKAKHFLAPMQRVRQRARTASGSASTNPDGSATDLADDVWTRRRGGRKRSLDGRSTSWTDLPTASRLVQVFSSSRATAAVLAPLVLIVVFLGLDLVRSAQTDVHTLGGRERSKVSPYLVSAYRDDEGRGRTLIDRLPWSGIASALAALVVAIFFVTSSDSGSFVVDMLTSGGHPNPPVAQRIFWAVSEGVVAAMLLLAGGLAALQSAAINPGLPFCLILLAICAGLARALLQDAGEQAEAPVAAIAEEG